MPEQLEERVVLNAAPVGVPDLAYVTPLNTALNGTGMLANDWDPEGSSLSATVHTSPANGALSSWNGSAGTWTYTPDTSFAGEDWFSYTVSDGTSTSDPVMVRIGVGKHLGPQTNLEDAPRGNPLLTGVVPHIIFAVAA